MRLFQNYGLYPGYRKRFDRLARSARTHAERKQVFLADRYGAVHFLLPVLRGDSDTFFTNADDDILQRLWAQEHGLPAESPPDRILLAQIEEHRTEVFYNLDPMRYPSSFVRRLPGCVKHAIAWRAAPSGGADFSAYDLVVCNFDGILDHYRRLGWRASRFFPALDPEMDRFAVNVDRPVDVVFVGGYSRHHERRARILEAVAQRAGRHRVVLHLDRSRLTRWAESPLGRLLPLQRHRRPAAIRAVSADPVFGIDLYAALSQAKIVLNAAVDMAGEDRGNMRCFEAMGCGALMVSDAGRYPDGMADGETMLTYRDPGDAVAVIEGALARPERSSSIQARAHRVIAERYNKARQWEAFGRLVGSL